MIVRHICMYIWQGQVSVPGTISAVVMERVSDVEEGYSKTVPLTFHFGSKNPADNMTLFYALVSRMAEVVNIRSEQSQRGDCCPWTMFVVMARS